MIKPDSVNPVDSRYQRAGWTYLVLGLAIFGLTVLVPELAAPERRSDIVHLLIGLPFFALFAYLIGRGERPVAALLRLVGFSSERALAIGRLARRILVMVLTVSAAGRTAVFFANAVGKRPRLDLSSLSLQVEDSLAQPKMFLSAVLMAVILVNLIRAWWPDLFARRES